MAEPAPFLDDKTKALIREGMFKPFDGLVLFALVSGLLTMAAWVVFGTPTAVGILACLAGLNLLILVWLAFLVLRCIRFVIDTRAEINMMPEHAARLALQFGRK
jgi:hypothetical protein